MTACENIFDEMTDETALQVIKKVHLLTGISMAIQKKAMIQSRLRRRMRELKIQTYEEYMSYLERTSEEKQHFINVITTNETFFFRTPRIWDYFQKDFLPLWIKSNPKGILKVWSAASSSGEEAYSIAICCQEFKERNPGFDYQIFGSDISSTVLDEANAGEYFNRSIEFIRKGHPILFEKYFKEKSEGVYAISTDLKKKVQFSAHNLFTLKKETFDIVFLRNVLIYFSAEDQEKVLMNTSKSIRAEGILIIGESESLNRLQTPYEFKAACIYKLPGKG